MGVDRLKSKQCQKLFCHFTKLQIRQNGFRNCVVLSPQEIRPRLTSMPCLLKPTWNDPQVQLEHVPSVLQGVRQGYWFQEVGLILQCLINQNIQFLNIEKSF